MPSKWHKTRCFPDLCFPTESSLKEESPLVKFIGVARLNDRAAELLQNGQFALAYITLKEASTLLVTLDRHELRKAANVTFANIIPSPALAKLLDVSLLTTEESGTNLFPYAIRICGSDLPAKPETLSAVVLFNLALTRHAQAVRSLQTVESSSGSASRSSSSTTRSPTRNPLVQSARRYYEKALIQDESLHFLRAAAYCNLMECTVDKEELGIYRAGLDDALADLDDRHHLAVFQHLILVPAAAA